MPVEFEYKYLITKDMTQNTLEEFLNKNKIPWKSEKIEQAYFEHKGRVRKKTSLKSLENDEKSKNEHPKEKYYFTFKESMGSKSGDLEIECNITKEDFETAWALCQGRTLTKTRYSFQYNQRIWEMDFFFEDPSASAHANGIVLECEVEDTKDPQQDLPDFIKSQILHCVELGNRDFNNKNLINIQNFEKIYTKYTS